MSLLVYFQSFMRVRIEITISIVKQNSENTVILQKKKSISVFLEKHFVWAHLSHKIMIASAL